ncbi:amidohydrolase [Candidatus Bipolaricaulota bacterium]|nr:amidohydrolase [Candidatus Bipolaricaulota bacterium]MBS3825568.1 amidohydrolase [Candidatus Bipolaricaulota bacterium]
MKIHLKNFDLLLPTESSPIKGASVFVKDDRIERIIREPAEEKAISVDETIEGQGRLLLPGFINAHTHLGMTLFRGYADDIELDRWLKDWIWPAEEKLTPEEVYWASLLGIIESIRSGTTTVADMYFNMDETAKALEDSGIGGLISYGIIAEELDKDGEEELQKGLNLVEEWDGRAGGKIRVALSPHAPYTCGDSVLKEVSRLSSAREIPIHTHVSETKKEVEESYEKFDRSPVERLDSLGVLENQVLAAHCVHLSEKDMEILKTNNVIVAHNPTSNMKISSGSAPISKMLNRGIKVTVGTDGPGTNNDLDMFEEMRQATFLAKLESDDPTAVDAEEVLSMATGRNVEQFGFSGLGKVEEGTRADLIGLERKAPYWTPEYETVSNLVYTGKSKDVDFVMGGGEIIMENGEIRTVNESKVINQVRKIGKKYEKIRQKNK